MNNEAEKIVNQMIDEMDRHGTDTVTVTRNSLVFIRQALTPEVDLEKLKREMRLKFMQGAPLDPDDERRRLNDAALLTIDATINELSKRGLLRGNVK